MSNAEPIRPPAPSERHAVDILNKLMHNVGQGISPVDWLADVETVLTLDNDGQQVTKQMVAIWLCDNTGAHKAVADPDEVFALCDVLKAKALQARSGIIAVSSSTATELGRAIADHNAAVAAGHGN